MNIELEKIIPGDIFNEESHYVVKGTKHDCIVFKHLETEQEVALNNRYVIDILFSGKQHDTVVPVTREDKKDGTLGIRSIFENIHSGKVFRVTFIKQDKPKTKKQYNLDLENQVSQASIIIKKEIESGQTPENAYNKALTWVQNNPILNYFPGETRVLNGWKIQFTSRDGKYDCVDADLRDAGEVNYIRQVNINSIVELIVDGIKYYVE